VYKSSIRYGVGVNIARFHNLCAGQPRVRFPVSETEIFLPFRIMVCYPKHHIPAIIDEVGTSDSSFAAWKWWTFDLVAELSPSPSEEKNRHF
jgi:hypothetical protein